MGLAYGAPTAITITAATLANAALKESLKVGPNTTHDIMVTVKATAGASAISATGVVNVYVAGSMDGTEWPDRVTGADAAVTALDNPPNVRIGAILNLTTANQVSRGFQFSVRGMFGNLPQYFSIIVENKTGAALVAFSATYQTITYS